MKNKPNLILMTDSYKLSHWKQYPKGMKKVYSYLESRGGKFPKTLFFGLQYYLKEYLEGSVVTMDDVKEATEFAKLHFGTDIYNKEGWEYIVKRHGGKLPIKIKAVKEGSLVPVSNVLMTIENTDPNCYWLTNVLETLLMKIWYTITVATNGFYSKKVISEYLTKTGTNTDSLPFKLHDFGYRGVSSEETAGIGGMSHLVNFMGTDTLKAILFAKEYYSEDMAGFSVPASEHSVACSFGKDHEDEYFLNMLEQYPTGIVSIVSDTYNVFEFVENMSDKYRKKIIERDGTVVFRPDCYDNKTQILTNIGWKYFKDINKNTLVAQVLDDGSHEFVQPTKIINEKYRGDMYYFTDFHGKIDVLVTPNHRMLYKKQNKWEESEAQNIKIKNYHKKLIRSSQAVNNNKNLTFIERLNIIFQADGSYVKNSKSRIRFSFSKKRKIKRLENLLKNNNIKHKIYQLKDGKLEFYIKLDSKNFFKDFNWVDITNLDGNWCKEFIEELSHWDSHIRNSGKIKFDTTNSDVNKIVELIALSAGYGCYQSVYSDDRKEIFSDVYTSFIMPNNNFSGQNINTKIKKYEGTIHCVTVPTGRIMVKRNQSTLVCGNSGNPVEINARLINLLWNKFGGDYVNGYKLLDSHVRLIQGDGIDIDMIEQILHMADLKGFAAENWVFGSGGGLLQKFDRDTQKFAIKASYGEREVDGKLTKFPISKDPITSKGKRSKGGRLVLHSTGDSFMTFTSEKTKMINSYVDSLELVFENGEIKRLQTFEEIRNIANNYLDIELKENE